MFDILEFLGLLDVLVRTGKNVSTVKKAISPNMSAQKTYKIVLSRFDSKIKEYEARGLKYGEGRFRIKYVDEKHFNLEFEMYFQDEEGKWHKCANESEPREATLLEDGTWKTIQDLRTIEFRITKSDKTLEFTPV